jgi:hypothetical protein
MGKAAKQRVNTIANQVKRNKENKDFIEMIEAMNDDKLYKIKKGNGYLFGGLNASGAYWKSQFLTKKEESDGQN